MHTLLVQLSSTVAHAVLLWVLLGLVAKWGVSLAVLPWCLSEFCGS